MKAHIKALGFAIMFVCLATAAASVWTAPVVQGNDSGGTDEDIKMFAIAGGSGQHNWREVRAFVLIEGGDKVDDPIDVYVNAQRPEWNDEKFNPSGHEFGSLKGIHWDDDPEPSIMISQEDFDNYSPDGVNLTVWALGEYVREGPGEDELRQAYLKVQVQRPNNPPVARAKITSSDENGHGIWDNWTYVENNNHGEIVYYIDSGDKEMKFYLNASISYDPDGDEITDVRWDLNGNGSFGYGDRERQMNTTAYLGEGDHLLGLIVGDGNALSRVLDIYIVVIVDSSPPKANAGPDQLVDERIQVAFDGSSSTDDVGIVNYTWTFNDGTGNVTLYGVAPTHTFPVPGTYTVTLTVSDAAGLTDTDTMTITVNDITPPSANAGADQTVDERTQVTFDGSTSMDNVGIVNYIWAFHDGTEDITLYGVAPNYTFTVPGIYTVTLIVSDAAGFTDTDTMTVTVNDITPPTAHAGPDQTVDEGAQVTFNGSASTDNVGIVNYIWTFHDGNGNVTLDGVAPTHTFTVPGIYVVKLNVKDATGNWDTDTLTITVNDITPPTAHAGHDQIVDEGFQVTFNGRVSTDNVGIVNYTWTFHDGTEDITLYGSTPKHTFRVPGNYTVTLTVTDAAGLTDTDTMVVTVLNAELAIHSVVYTPQKPKEGDTVTIIVTLKNTGEATTRNVTVAVKMNAVLIKTLEFDDIPVGEMAAMQFPWTVLTGTYTLEVELSYTGGEDTHTQTFEVSSTTTTDPSDEKKGSDSPGFEMIGALAAVGLAVVLFRKRRG